MWTPLAHPLADQIVTWDVEDRSVPITVAHVDAAKETIILERRSHIDSLIARLHEPRLRKILDPMIAGEQPPVDMLDDDLHDALGLGLIAKRHGGLQIANPIYREVIPRALTWVWQVTMAVPQVWYVRPDGSLDLDALLSAFQTFWREHGHLAAEGFHYRESGPHLMMMAFLQRIVNGGGRIEREYGLGRRALDLLVSWRDERFVLELKVRRDSETEPEALTQIGRYLDLTGLSEGWLVLFDLRSARPWADRLYRREARVGDRRVHVVGC